MKRRNIAFACLAAGVWLAGCGGGTLGGGVSTGGGGNIMITGSSAASGQGVAGNSGLGGDGAPAGGISGAAGRVGRGGAGGVSAGFSGSMGPGSGGSGFISCPPPPPVCGALCGNDKQETCIRALYPGCQPQAWTEECDGNDFGTDSCAARGFGSGKLLCRSDCTIDVSGCSGCGTVSAGGPIVRCGAVATQVPNVIGFALGATDSEVGLATMAYNDAGGTIMSFQRLAPTLDPLGGWISVEDTPLPPGQDTFSIYAIAVAPLPSGWILAGCGYPQVFFHTIDAAGREMARTVVDTLADPLDACLSGSLTLAPRPGGGPLLLWRSGSDVMASLIGDDGLSASAPQAIVGPAIYYNDTVSAVWVRDAFYAAVTVERSATDYRGLIRLVRLPPSGTQTRADVLADESIYGAPALASGALDLRLLYDGVPPGGVDGSDYAVLWRQLGSSGEALSDPAVAGVFPYLYGPSRAVAFGADTLVAINANYVNGRLALVHLASDGRIVPPTYDVTRSPFYYLGSFDMVRRGSDVVVGWLADGLQLARVTP